MDDMEKLIIQLDTNQPLWWIKYATQQELSEFAEDTSSPFNSTVERRSAAVVKSKERLRYQVARRIWPIANAAYEAFNEQNS